MLRARKDWTRYADRPSKYYLNLECKSYKRRNRFHIKKSSGELISGITNVLKEQYEFYENLYKSEMDFKKTRFNKFTEPLKWPKLKIEDRERLEQDFSMKELCHAVFSSKRDKVAGSDGISIEFYQTFFEPLKGLMLETCLQAAKTGLHSTAQQGIITLIEKADKDVNFLTNWRPLSLLNCDGKCYAKMLACRLETVAPYLIHQDQSRFMKNRSIHDNLLDLMSVIDYTENKKLNALILSFDFEKAFNKVNFEYLDVVLEAFNFGKNFRTMVANAHKNTTSCTVNGGGCPLHTRKLNRDLDRDNQSVQCCSILQSNFWDWQLDKIPK